MLGPDLEQVGLVAVVDEDGRVDDLDENWAIVGIFIVGATRLDLVKLIERDSVTDSLHELLGGAELVVLQAILLVGFHHVGQHGTLQREQLLHRGIYDYFWFVCSFLDYLLGFLVWHSWC